MEKIINIMGGIGKCIAATGVLKKGSVIMTNHPEPFLSNPNVKRTYIANTPYLFDDVIKKMDYVEPTPYKMKEYYAEKKHVTRCFNLVINGEDKSVMPKLYLTETEEEQAQAFVESCDKEIVLVQPFGEGGGKGKPDGTFRSLKPVFAEKLMRKLSKKYKVLMIKAGNQMGFKGIDSPNAKVRDIISLLPHVKTFVTIDSFLQHAGAAVGKPGFVFWGATSELNEGYEMHNNFRNKRKITSIHTNPYNNNRNADVKLHGINTFTDNDMKKCLDWVDKQVQSTKPREVKDGKNKDDKECKKCRK